MGLAPAWYNWYSIPDNGNWMKWLYGLLDGRWLVNIPICLTISYLAVCWCIRIWQDNNLRFFRPVIAILGLVLLYWASNVDFAKVVACFDYKGCLTILLVASLATMIVKLFKIILSGLKEKDCKPKEGKEEITVKGFSDDNTGEETIPDSLKQYACEIVARLLVTNIKEQSFALGVTGEWGVGKTTFLGELKKKIGNKAEIVDFNPWMCSSPEQVTKDFFASLQHQLSPKYSTLSRSIKEYAKYVNNVTIAHSALSLEKVLPIEQESLYERKRSLSRKFAKLPRPVVVVIDDVDRLERDEVFEVLRLIRNTADLSNIIYLVAYDKEYVTCVLEEKNIKDSSAYLEKIFPVEVHLPKVEEHLVWKTLYAEITKQSDEGEDFTKLLFNCLNSDAKELILKILDNYRRAKRFARVFMLNIGYINQHSRNELKILDVFWLELLQMYDKRTYDILSEESSRLLYRDGERLKIREGVLRPATDKDTQKFEGKPFWKNETPKILEKMFGSYIKTRQQSICYAENYDKFFTLSVSPFRLSIKEMKQLFEKGQNPVELVGKWLKEGKYLNSITYQFRQINANKLTEEQLKTYLYALLGFCMKVAPYRNNHVWEVKKMLRDERYAKGVDLKAHDIIMQWFGENLNIDEKLAYLSQLLNCLYLTRFTNPEGKEEPIHPLVISNEEIESLLIQLLKTYLSNHQEATALDVLKENGVLPYIFKKCCVTVADAMATENYCEYKQVAFNAVIDHFAAKEIKPTIKEYNDALGGMFNEEPPVFDNPQDEDMYWDFAGEAYENKMQEYFGSLYDNKGKLLEFKRKCFVEEKDAVKVATVKETND